MLWLASLLLPAFQTRILGEMTILPGWMAAGLAFAAIDSVISQPTRLAFPLAALANLAFVLAPWTIVHPRCRRYARPLSLGLAAATLCALYAPTLIAGPGTMLRVGYYVWIAAQGVLGVSLVLKG